MRPNRILRYLLVAFVVTLGLLTRDSGGVPSAEPVRVIRPRIVGISPLGTVDRRQVMQMRVNRLSGEVIVFGYLNYIHGLKEEQLYLGGEADHGLESRALITLYIEAQITRVHRNGPLLAYEALGQSTIFFDSTPDGDYADPETFRNGTPIATGEENVVFTFDPETETGTGDVRLRQTQAWPFEFNGELIQFGKVGNHTVSWRGKTLSGNPLGWTRLFATATTVQAAPGPE